jgi:hypothetical protein
MLKKVGNQAGKQRKTKNKLLTGVCLEVFKTKKCASAARFDDSPGTVA